MWQELLRSRGELWRELSSDKKIERRWMLAILEFLERFENPTKSAGYCVWGEAELNHLWKNWQKKNDTFFRVILYCYWK